MAKRIYVGNLPFNCDEATVRRLFAPFGKITAVSLPSGRSRGFGFVEFASPEAGLSALKGLAGSQLGGQRLEITDRVTG